MHPEYDYENRRWFEAEAEAVARSRWSSRHERDEDRAEIKGLRAKVEQLEAELDRAHALRVEINRRDHAVIRQLRDELRIVKANEKNFRSALETITLVDPSADRVDAAKVMRCVAEDALDEGLPS